jgi:hypothetical protein
MTRTAKAAKAPEPPNPYLGAFTSPSLHCGGGSHVALAIEPAVPDVDLATHEARGNQASSGAPVGSPRRPRGRAGGHGVTGAPT